MAVTTFCGDLRQLIPLFQIVFRKPGGESAVNVEMALRKIDEMMQRKFNIDFEPSNWTSDNSGAIENGIIRVKGPFVKAKLGSDKLHDGNNLKRVLRSLPLTIQASVEREIRLMINIRLLIIGQKPQNY